ncbi:hypothetical protein B0H16DRAFT_1685250 [Mycena metata]|uniref:Uncharacterized protein n=1 Tax=Mycena metata TaxID=1033252 RepID=A0AAD7JWY9_9AGAR|nr:hypothetical protein B0H16DRAFT_1685250 [Mycena metata]
MSVSSAERAPTHAGNCPSSCELESELKYCRCEHFVTGRVRGSEGARIGVAGMPVGVEASVGTVEMICGNSPPKTRPTGKVPQALCDEWHLEPSSRTTLPSLTTAPLHNAPIPNSEHNSPSFAVALNLESAQTEAKGTLDALVERARGDGSGRIHRWLLSSRNDAGHTCVSRRVAGSPGIQVEASLLRGSVAIDGYLHGDAHLSVVGGGIQCGRAAGR